jgi:hypothetical protein
MSSLYLGILSDIHSTQDRICQFQQLDRICIHCLVRATSRYQATFISILDRVV